MDKIHAELLELVKTGVLQEKEALLLSKIRDGEIKNPLDETQEVEAPKALKELNKIKDEINTEIETATIVIDKFEKSIEILSGQSLFEINQILTTNDEDKLKTLSENLIEEMNSFVTDRKEHLLKLVEKKDNLIRAIEPVIDFYEIKEITKKMNEITNSNLKNSLTQ